MASSILQVCLDDSPNLGGLTRGIRDIRAALGGRIVSIDSGRLPPSRDDSGAALTRIAAGRGVLRSRLLRLSPSVIAQLAQAVSVANLVICHSLYRAHLPIIRSLCSERGIPYWVVTHGMLDPWVLARQAIAKRLWLSLQGRQGLRDAARVIFATQAEKDKATEVYAAGNCIVVPWPVTVPVIAGRAAARSIFRDRLGIPANGRILLWLGRYDELKRPVEIVQIFSRIAPQGWHLVMAGYEGNIGRRRVAKEATNVEEGRVAVLGALEGSDKEQAFLAADAFVSLSWRESFGYSLAEAMAYGLPSFVTPGHDLIDQDRSIGSVDRAASHFIPDLESGLLAFLSRDPAAMAVAGAAARARIISTCDRQVFEDRMQSLVVETVGRNAPLKGL
ncbi:MAG: glycosyltransferase [Planctomycetota bacterium]